MISRDRIAAALLFTALCSASAAGAQDGTTTTTTTDSTTTTTSDGGADPTWVAPAAPGEGGTSEGLTSRPFYVGGGIGLDVGLNGGGGVLFSAEEDIGFRFFGFNLGGANDGAIFAGLSFGQAGGSNFVGLQFDVRGGVDFEVWDGGDMQLLVTPSITLGGGVFIVSFTDAFGNNNTSTNGAFDFGFATQGELVMLDGLLGLWLRPLSFELYINSGVGALYELLAGVMFRL
jgi:hypothetical protein